MHIRGDSARVILNHQPIRRIVTGVIFIPILVFCLLSNQIWWLTGIVTMVALWGINEFYNLVARKGIMPFRKFGTLMVLLFCLNGPIWLRFATPVQLIVVLILGSFLLALIRLNPDNNHSILRISTTVIGVLYIALPLGLMLYIWQIPRGGFYLLWLIAITWMCDTGAYAIGSVFGKHKLCPTISPNKTIEGCLGGLGFGILAGWVVQWIITRYFTSYLFPSVLMLLYAAGIALTAQLGDLAESVLKREVGVKDSGNTYTGHGGMLDIIDSLLFTIPVLYLILKIYY
ncbi:MAG: phosphatidate cytidylyltransferase [bacterium]|nr:phosphatidate cytidylyltransferase [bacterium]